MITSQHATSASPAPTAAPLMAPITGSGQSLSAQKQSRTMLPGSSRSTMLSSADLLAAVAPRRVVEVDAAAEHALARGGEDRHVRVGAVAQLGERLLDLAERLRVQRVDRRTVEGDRGDAVVDLDVDVLHLLRSVSPCPSSGW